MTSENPADSPTPAAPHAQENSTKEADNPEGTELPTIRAAVEIPPSHASYKITCQKKRDGWDRAKMAAEFVGIIFLIIYTLYTCGIYRANKKVADAAKGANHIAHDSLVRSARPWVGNGDVIPLKPIRLIPGEIEFLSDVVLTNYGPSPALNISSWMGVALNLQELDGAAEDTCKVAITLAESKSGDKGEVLFPSQKRVRRLGGKVTLAADDAKKIEFVYVVGCIAYRDQFQEGWHKTRFCEMGVNFPSYASLVFTHCPKYNDAD